MDRVALVRVQAAVVPVARAALAERCSQRAQVVLAAQGPGGAQGREQAQTGSASSASKERALGSVRIALLGCLVCPCGCLELIRECLVQAPPDA